VLVWKIHQLQILVLDTKTLLQCKWNAVGGFLDKAFGSWLVIGKSALQSVDFSNKHFVVGGILLGRIECVHN